MYVCCMALESPRRQAVGGFLFGERIARARARQALARFSFTYVHIYFFFSAQNKKNELARLLYFCTKTSMRQKWRITASRLKREIQTQTRPQMAPFFFFFGAEDTQVKAVCETGDQWQRLTLLRVHFLLLLSFFMLLGETKKKAAPEWGWVRFFTDRT